MKKPSIYIRIISFLTVFAFLSTQVAFANMQNLRQQTAQAAVTAKAMGDELGVSDLIDMVDGRIPDWAAKVIAEEIRVAMDEYGLDAGNLEEFFNKLYSIYRRIYFKRLTLHKKIAVALDKYIVTLAAYNQDVNIRIERHFKEVEEDIRMSGMPVLDDNERKQRQKLLDDTIEDHDWFWQEVERCQDKRSPLKRATDTIDTMNRRDFLRLTGASLAALGAIGGVLEFSNFKLGQKLNKIERDALSEPDEIQQPAVIPLKYKNSSTAVASRKDGYLVITSTGSAQNITGSLFFKTLGDLPEDFIELEISTIIIDVNNFSNVEKLIITLADGTVKEIRPSEFSNASISVHLRDFREDIVNPQGPNGYFIRSLPINIVKKDSGLASSVHLQAKILPVSDSYDSNAASQAEAVGKKRVVITDNIDLYTAIAYEMDKKQIMPILISTDASATDIKLIQVNIDRINPIEIYTYFTSASNKNMDISLRFPKANFVDLTEQGDAQAALDALRSV